MWIIFAPDGVYDTSGELLGVPEISPASFGSYRFSVVIKGKAYRGHGQPGLLQIYPANLRSQERLPRVKWGNCPPEEKKRLYGALRAFWRQNLGETNKPVPVARQFCGQWYLELWRNNKLIGRL